MPPRIQTALVSCHNCQKTFSFATYNCQQWKYYYQTGQVRPTSDFYQLYCIPPFPNYQDNIFAHCRRCLVYFLHNVATDQEGKQSNRAIYIDKNGLCIECRDKEEHLITSNNQALNAVPLSEIGKYPINVYCDTNIFPTLLINLQAPSCPLSEKECQQVNHPHYVFRDQEVTIDNEKRKIKIGEAIIQERRGASEDNPDSRGTRSLKLLHKLVPEFTAIHPSTDKKLFQEFSRYKNPPRFEVLQEGTFENVCYIDIKSCYANIMRDYSLPCGRPEHLKDPQLIEQKLQEGKGGFVKFYLEKYALVKKQQIPFIPTRDYAYEEKRIKPALRGRKRLLLHTQKKGCANKYLDHCDKLKEKKETEKEGKIQLALLKTYYLYRQFLPENVLTIRSDCVLVKEATELPPEVEKNKHLYKIKFFKKLKLNKELEIFDCETNILLKSPKS
ncbi:43646_t:CDS:2, partial [Gigaspora margarita]